MGVSIEASWEDFRAKTKGYGWLDMGCEGGRSQRWHYDIQIRVDNSRRGQEINSTYKDGSQ